MLGFAGSTLFAPSHGTSAEHGAVRRTTPREPLLKSIATTGPRLHEPRPLRDQAATPDRCLGGGVTAATPRRLAWGGIVGPAAFVLAWSSLGVRAVGYSSIRDPISRLAAASAPTQAAMTVGFVTFGAGVIAYAIAARGMLSSRTALAATITATATAGIAALPLGTRAGGVAHATAAGIAYAGLTATQFVGGRALADLGHRRAAHASTAAALATAFALAASVADDSRTGLLQRTGLSIGDTWLIVTSIWMLRRARHTPAAESAAPTPTRHTV